MLALRKGTWANSARILVLDDDPKFGGLVAALAAREGLSVEIYPSLADLGGLSRLREFDIVVVGYCPGSLNWRELSQFMDVFCRHGVDVVLISPHLAHELFEHSWGASWTSCIQRFVNKNQGVDVIFGAVRDVLRVRGFEAHAL